VPIKQLVQLSIGLSRTFKRTIVLCSDIVLCALTVWLAFYLRLGEWIGFQREDWRLLLATFTAIGVSIPIFILSGLYRNIFRYSGLPVLITLVRATSIYGVIYALIFTIIGFQGVPRTIGLLQPILLGIAVGGSRIIASFLLGGVYRARPGASKATRTLIYGAGSTGQQLASALLHNSQLKIVGFLDDDPQLIGNALNGKFIYSSTELNALIRKFGITDVLLALPNVNRRRRNEIITFIQSCKVHVRTLPSVVDLAKGRITFSDIRELDVEDLLGRDAIAPDISLLRKNIHNKVVLVTGAGGSIGSELCRQILLQNPKALILLEQGEFNLYRLHQELTQTIINLDKKGIELIPMLASVRDDNNVRRIISRYRPQTIYHAAAYKHVPLVESNPFEGIQNNVFGTLVMAQAAVDLGVESFTLISTDKAVRPTNVMGASKRLAEMTLQAIAALQDESSELAHSKTIVSMVRFGNVLDSSGSVVPKFKEQIQMGGPVTLTDSNVTRYFMTIPEAAQLVIQASAMAKGGEVFLLDMGEPIKILDLASRMIELSGLTISNENNPEGDIEIVVTGLRPGEKLFEELLIGNNPQKTENARIMKAHEDFLPMPVLQIMLQSLKEYCEIQDRQSVKLILQELVSGYMPDEVSE